MILGSSLPARAQYSTRTLKTFPLPFFFPFIFPTYNFLLRLFNPLQTVMYLSSVRICGQHFELSSVNSYILLLYESLRKKIDTTNHVSANC